MEISPFFRPKVLQKLIHSYVTTWNECPDELIVKHGRKFDEKRAHVVSNLLISVIPVNRSLVFIQPGSLILTFSLEFTLTGNHSRTDRCKHGKTTKYGIYVEQ